MYHSSRNISCRIGYLKVSRLCVCMKVKVFLRINQKPLTSSKPKCVRWVFKLSEYQFDIDLVNGCNNAVSDALSCEDDKNELHVLAVTRFS